MSMSMMSMSIMMGYLCDERGAEMVEWIVVVAVLAVVAGLVFGPTGVLHNALNTGIQNISNQITSAS